MGAEIENTFHLLVIFHHCDPTLLSLFHLYKPAQEYAQF